MNPWETPSLDHSCACSALPAGFRVDFFAAARTMQSSSSGSRCSRHPSSIFFPVVLHDGPVTVPPHAPRHEPRRSSFSMHRLSGTAHGARAACGCERSVSTMRSHRYFASGTSIQAGGAAGPTHAGDGSTNDAAFSAANAGGDDSAARREAGAGNGIRCRRLEFTVASAPRDSAACRATSCRCACAGGYSPFARAAPAPPAAGPVTTFAGGEFAQPAGFGFPAGIWSRPRR